MHKDEGYDDDTEVEETGNDELCGLTPSVTQCPICGVPVWKTAMQQW